MKKIININLHGRVIPIEDAAYEALQRYIDSLRGYFAREEGRDEIINDIESRVAELMNDKLRKGATVITEADIAEITATMGRVEDFAAAEGETAGESAGTSTNAGAGRERPRFKGRLYRDADDKFIGGVCAGIAAYTNIDPTVVRLLFAIVTFGGFGIGFLIYIVLWIVLPTSRVEGYRGKRFFRNPDDSILGGVAGGLAAYFNKNPWTIRAIFAAPLLLKLLFAVLNVLFSPFNSDVGFNIATGSLTGTFFLAYIVLWIVLPEAKTQYDKMEMRGEKVDINRIKENVQAGMGTFKERMQAWGEEVKTSAEKMSARAQEFTKTQGADFASDVRQTVRPVGRGIGHAIGVLFKAFFLFIAGVIAFALFVVVLAFIFGGLSQPVNAFLIEGTAQKFYMWGTLLFFLAVPLIAIIVWIIRRVMNVRSQTRYLGWIFGGLWTLGWVAATLLVSSLVKDFRSSDRTETDIPLRQPYANKLTVQVPGSPIRYSGDFGWVNIDDEDGWDVTEDSLKLSNVRINVKPSEDSQYHVTLSRYSNGSSRRLALQRAENIAYPVMATDSLLQLAPGFGVSSSDKYRNQRVTVEIRIPVGRQIRFDRSVADKLNPFNVHVNERENYGRRRNWNRRDWEVDWDNDWYYSWEADTDYTMGADGKLHRSDKAAAPSKPANRKRDSLMRELRRLDSAESTGSEPAEESTAPTKAETTQQKEEEQQETGGDIPTPMPVPFVPTIF